MDWSDLRFLLELHRAGTLIGAARTLQVSHTTVSRRIEALEEALGVALLIRKPDGVSLTSAGEAAVRTAIEVETSCLALQRRMAGENLRPGGLVRVTATEGFAPFLMGAFAQLRTTHPAVQVDVIATHSRLDLSRGEADIAVRLFRETQADLLTRSLGTIGWSLYASEEYISRRGAFGTELSFEDHEVVGYDPSISTPGGNWLNNHAANAHIVLRGNSTRSVATAVAAGVGLSALPCFMELTDPKLRRLTPTVITRNEAWSVHHPDLRSATRIRVVLDHLEEFFSSNRRVLAGEH